MLYNPMVFIHIRIYQRKSLNYFQNAHSLISVSNPARTHKSLSCSCFLLIPFQLLLRPVADLIVAKAYLFFCFSSPSSTDGRRRRFRCLFVVFGFISVRLILMNWLRTKSVSLCSVRSTRFDGCRCTLSHMAMPVSAESREKRKKLIDELCKRQVNDKNSKRQTFFFSLRIRCALISCSVLRGAVHAVRAYGTRTQSKNEKPISNILYRWICVTNNGMHQISSSFVHACDYVYVCVHAFIAAFVCSVNLSAEARTMFNETTQKLYNLQ